MSDVDTTQALTLRIGGRYQTRGNGPVLIDNYVARSQWPWKGHNDAGIDLSWRDDGTFSPDDRNPHSWDIVEEIIEPESEALVSGGQDEAAEVIQTSSGADSIDLSKPVQVRIAGAWSDVVGIVAHCHVDNLYGAYTRTRDDALSHDWYRAENVRNKPPEPIRHTRKVWINLNRDGSSTVHCSEKDAVEMRDSDWIETRECGVEWEVPQ